MFQASEASLTCATAKGNLLALGGNEEVVKLFDLKTKKSCGDLSGEHTGPITCLVTTAKHVLSGSVDGMIVIWRTEDMEVIHKLVVKNVSKVVSLSMH
jgi:protein MAK11